MIHQFSIRTNDNENSATVTIDAHHIPSGEDRDFADYMETVLRDALANVWDLPKEDVTAHSQSN